MATKLTDEEVSILRYAATHQGGLLWGGVHDRGGDPVISPLVSADLLSDVAEPYWSGRSLFRGGYRITPAGLTALKEQEKGE